MTTAYIGEDEIKVCSIPAVVILKLIAYDDRPEHRPSDPIDIDSIIAYYPKIETEMIWDEYSFLYDDKLDHKETGIKVLGYEMSKIIIQNEKLTQRILDILSASIALETRLAEQMIQDAVKETLESKVNILQLLKVGIEE